ncbi:unnamed protein product, partial [Amoebophrya sp. A25]|eukprot:GSA25T00025626001.1
MNPPMKMKQIPCRAGVSSSSKRPPPDQEDLSTRPRKQQRYTTLLQRFSGMQLDNARKSEGPRIGDRERELCKDLAGDVVKFPVPDEETERLWNDYEKQDVMICAIAEDGEPKWRPFGLDKSLSLPDSLERFKNAFASPEALTELVDNVTNFVFE